MPDFPKITPPERRETDYSDLFDAGQIDNFIIGVNRGVDGFNQAFTEAKESLGIIPEGSAEFLTQELKKDQKILREASADDQKLTGAPASEFVGEALPLFAVPLGGSVKSAAALGGLSTSGFFQDDVTDSRLDDISLGAISGGLFRALLRGGKARSSAERAISDVEQLALPAPAQRVGQRLLTDQRQLALPRPAPRASSARASLRDRGLGADDFQNAGRNPIPGFQGIPKKISPARRAIDLTTNNGQKLAQKAARKLEVFSANAARKAEKLKKMLQSPKIGAKTSAAIQKKITKELSDKVTASSMKKSIEATAAKSTSKTPISLSKIEMKGNRLFRDGKPISKFDALNDLDRNLARPGEFISRDDRSFTSKEVADLYNSRLKKNKQGGFAESDLVNTIGGAAAGGTLGLAVSDGDPIAGIAGALGGGAIVRKLGQRADKIVTNKMREGMRKASEQGGTFTENVSRLTKARDASAQTIANVLSGGRQVLDSFMGATMTRLEQLAPRVAVALKEAEFQQHFRSGQWLSEGDKLFKRVEDSGLTDAQRETYKIHLLNSTEQAKRYLRTIGKEDAALAVDDFSRLLSDVGVYLRGVGLGENLRKNYFPRMVKDLSQFEKIEEVNTYLQQLAKKKGIKLTDFEKETAITEIINGALTRGNEGTNFGRAAGALKRRTNKVTNKNVSAYADPHEGFNDYIESITNQVERRRFFQGQNVKVSDLGPNAENIETVASRLKDQLKRGGLSIDDLDEVTQLVRMRFGPGEQAPIKAVQNFKNLTYAGLLGNPAAAATQFGDIALSAYRNGVANTVKSVLGQIGGQGKAFRELDKDTLLGIRNAAADFQSKTPTRDLLNWSLKWSGFQAVDRLGKNTFIQSAMMKNQQLTDDAFRARWKSTFDPDAQPGGPTPRTDGLLQKVKNYKGLDETNREDIGFMLWNELSDVQPIALSALPEQYLKNPNGRMAYMLQSFTLKLFDVMRKDIYKNVQAGNHVQAAKNATKLSTLFVSMNGGVDSFKNFMLQKDSTVPDTVMNNYLKMLGMNKFMITQAEREGLGSTVLKTIAPPTVLIDAVTKPKEALKLLPPFGKLIESRIPE